MVPEYFVNSFINEFTMYNNLFQYNLEGNEYKFISRDYLLLINNAFINCIKIIPSNSINNFGVSLLVRNFEFIKDKLGSNFTFADNKFTQTIFYFPNYIKLLNCNEDSIITELKRYYEVQAYDEEFVTPLLKIRTNSRHTLNEFERTKIIDDVFK
jgi:hypothetical protein